MNEVSKLGQSDDGDEVLEGRVVPASQGPFDWGVYLDAMREELNRNRREYRENIYRAGKVYVSTDGTDWEPIGTTGTVTYERGPSFTEGWWDEVREMPKLFPVTIETTFENVSDEFFEMLSGYPKGVALLVGQHFGDKPEIPPVDIERVRWPGWT